jgi:hypothetical protein
MRLASIAFGSNTFLGNVNNNNKPANSYKGKSLQPAQDCFTRSKSKQDTSFYTFNDSFELSDYAYHKK